MKFEKKEKENLALADLVRVLRKKYGPNAIALGSDVAPLGRVSTGIEKLDEILRGGWPVGRITEVWGPQSAGKTTLLMRAIAALQKANPKARVAYFDLENTYDEPWAVKCGVNTKRLLRIGAMAAEEAGELLVKMVRDKWDMAIVDSVVELLPGKELERKVEEQSYAVVAGVLSRLLPKIVVLQSSSPTILLLVNQVRDKIGFFLGHAAKSPGGHAMFHLDSLKLRVQRKEPILGSMLTKRMAKAAGIEHAKAGKKYGFEMAIKVVKSKVSREGEECRVPVLFDLGIYQEADWHEEKPSDPSADGPGAGKHRK